MTTPEDEYEDELVSLLGEMADIVSVAHYKCSIEQEVCHAEQYGDGNASHHDLLRRIQTILEVQELT